MVPHCIVAKFHTDIAYGEESVQLAHDKSQKEQKGEINRDHKQNTQNTE
jgi:hypothetical protein